MAAVLQVLCLILVVGMVHNWTFPSNDFHDSSYNNSTSLSMFNDINKMMAQMHQRFQRLFGSSSFSMNDNDDWMEDRKKLDAVKPVCTTTESSTSTPIEKNRRKKFRPTQTTTCTKELILDGKKQIYKEMNVTNDKGILISQSKIYQTVSINTKPINSSEDKDVISY